MNYAFYISGGASRLIKFFESLTQIEKLFFLPKIKHIIYDGNHSEVITIINELIKNSNIKFSIISYENVKKKNQYISQSLKDIFISDKIDYCFCFGDRILLSELIDLYKNRIINFHPSILPSFPGLMAIDQCINSSAIIMGNTAHFIDEGIDTGPIIMQSIIPKSQYKDYFSILDLQIPMLKQLFKWLEADRIIIKGKTAQILNADYSIRDIYIPNLE